MDMTVWTTHATKISTPITAAWMTTWLYSKWNSSAVMMTSFASPNTQQLSSLKSLHCSRHLKQYWFPLMLGLLRVMSLYLIWQSVTPVTKLGVTHSRVLDI
ncbi:Hypothetical_protein [Hexamita inflata]|uniref:Hypothetical_protein n=1 Tax=Hexamita inflata TaxID=28002 RepID=A0AA86QGW8_9EUKA|nr:Hypothetical protein HINF_LOCUS46190 [Hexamita inflata]